MGRLSADTFVGRLAQRRGLRQFVKFGVVGASGFIVNLIIFTLLQRVVPNHAAPLQYNVIYSIAFLSGGVSNYFLNRAWTFRSTGHVGKEGLSFMAVSVIALIVGLDVRQRDRTVARTVHRSRVRARPPHVVSLDRGRYRRQLFRQ